LEATGKKENVPGAERRKCGPKHDPTKSSSDGLDERPNHWRKWGGFIGIQGKIEGLMNTSWKVG